MLEVQAVADDTDVERGSARIVEVVRALQEVATAINEETFDLDAILHLVARKVCAVLDVGRCTAYVKAPATGLYRGRVMETRERGRDWDQVVRRLVCGVEADRFSREIVATKGPVFLSDPQGDPRAIRSTMRTYGVRSMLGVPMVVRNDVTGLLFLDNLDQPHVFSLADAEIATTFANLAGTAISQATGAAELRTNLATIARQHKILRQSSIVEGRLARLALDGAGLSELAQAVAELTERPCAVYDLELRLLAAGQPDTSAGDAHEPLPEMHDVVGLPDVLATTDLGGSIIVGPLPPAVRDRFLAVSLPVREERAGYVLLRESGQPFTAIDVAAARRAAAILGLAVSAEQWAADTHAHARELLVRDLIAGVEDERVLVGRGRFCRMRLDKPHVVCLVRSGSDEGIIGPDELDAVRESGLFGGGCLSTLSEGSLVMLVELDEDVPPRAAVAQAKAGLERLLATLTPAGGLVGGVSSPCHSPREYRRGYDEARQLIRSVVAVRGDDAGHVVLTADDLGAARLLLSAADHGEAERFARDALGPLLRAQEAHATDLLSTLSEYFESSRSIRACAARLRVHENTVRYRLSRVAELTGLEVTSNASDQLVAHVALLVLRIGRRIPASPVPPADSA